MCVYEVCVCVDEVCVCVYEVCVCVDEVCVCWSSMFFLAPVEMFFSLLVHKHKGPIT